MGLSSLGRYPHVLKSIAFAVLLVLAAILWISGDSRRAQLITWQSLPYLLVLTFVYEKRDYIEEHPAWPAWEIFLSTLFLLCSLVNLIVTGMTVYDDPQKPLHFITTGVSMLLVCLWTWNLVHFAARACRRYRVVRKEPPELERNSRDESRNGRSRSKGDQKDNERITQCNQKLHSIDPPKITVEEPSDA
ncbi:unnamed protein product, partial [Mesorhabditis belari]|uniref:Uncharacterized protein n=1 Tax=Mesorhabditis belari TaxID=2138241 RepID=A0AAF3EZ95_9BILA